VDNQTEDDRHCTSRNFPQDRCSHVCRREHNRSLRHQRLSLDLIAGDYKNMGCREELTSGAKTRRDFRCLRRGFLLSPSICADALKADAGLGRTNYAAYYNELKTNRSLNKDAPFHRAIQRLGAITSQPVLGGLHHQYCRI
jgi:hypothetical protein